MVIMGRVVAPYGIYGWLKVQPHTEYLDGLLDYPDWWLGREDGLRKAPWQSYALETAKIHNDVLVVKLKGVDDRDAALRCKGLHVAVPRESLPEADEGEYYWSDLIGLSVTNQQGVPLGLVVELFETGANDVLVVKGDRERLIPYTAQAVIEVNLVEKTMLVDWDAEF
jgi:16S rRNA processing protein RimM